MQLTSEIQNFITQASSKALATVGDDGVNVVPVSAMKVTADVLYLYDFFMNKTRRNLQSSDHVALAVWSGLQGLQLKGSVVYHTTGSAFDEAVTWAKNTYPERVLAGIISFSPEELFDVSVGIKVVTG